MFYGRKGKKLWPKKGILDFKILQKTFQALCRWREEGSLKMER